MIDEWNGLAVLLADMIEKYAGELDLDAFPDPVFPEDKITNHDTNKNVYKENIETPKAALYNNREESVQTNFPREEMLPLENT